VSFEGKHRVLRYRSLEKKPTRLVLPKAIARAPRNGGLEAMTVLADGRLLMAAEGMMAKPGHLRAWVQKKEGGDFNERLLPVSDGYRPTDVAALDDGGALLLERMFKRNRDGSTTGPFARLRWLPAETLSPQADGVLSSKEVGRLDKGLVDNFEGLAVKRDGKDYLLYLLSDDNFKRHQKTLLYQLRWRRDE
jgi:hypothetical protein